MSELTIEAAPDTQTESLAPDLRAQLLESLRQFDPRTASEEEREALRAATEAYIGGEVPPEVPPEVMKPSESVTAEVSE